MSLQISVLTIGNELLDGRVADTNSNWIGNQLRSKGLSLTQVLSCSDLIPQIIESLNYLFKNCDIIIISGGLGPTTDDLTRDAIAELTGNQLIEDKQCLDHLNQYFETRKRPLTETNLRQGFLPKGANYIENPVGTAPAFWIRTEFSNQEKIIIALPGVPFELQRIWENSVMTLIQSHFNLSNNFSEVGLRVFGLPESEIGKRIESLNLPSDITVCYRTIFPEIEILLRSYNKDLTDLIKECSSAIGDKYVISLKPEIGLEHVVMQQCLSKKKKLSVAESCTGGMLGSIITSLPGSSSFFEGGVISYSNECKNILLKVNPNLILNDGAVSPSVASFMAQSILQINNSDFGLSITGVVGPDGGSTEKPVGTFFVGFSRKGQISLAFKYFMPGDRNRIRRYAAYSALDILRRHLVGLELPEHC